MLVLPPQINRLIALITASEKWREYFGLLDKPLVGIDIGSSAIKILQFQRNETGKFYVTQCARAALPPQTVSEKIIKNKKIVIQVLGDLLKNLKLNTNWVISSISGVPVIMRVIQMSRELTPKEMLEELIDDADKYIPYPIDEVNLDHVILGPNIDRPQTQVDVLLAASRTDHIEEQLSIFEAVGLKVQVIDLDAFCFERALPLLANQLPSAGFGKTIGLFDLGANTIALNVFQNFKRIYSREQSFGGYQLTLEIQRRYGLTFEEAEQAKIENRLPDDYFIEILEPYRMALIQHLSRFLQFFFSSESSSEIDYLVLTGGGSSLTGLDLLIQEKLLYPTFIPNPFQEMIFAEHIDPFYQSTGASQFMLACGLALRENRYAEY